MPELFNIGDFKEFRKRSSAIAQISYGAPMALGSAPRQFVDGPQVVVFAIDPGETTGWSIMAVSADALSDPEVAILGSPAAGGINFWAHGQVDCGAKTGNAGMSGTRGMGDVAGVGRGGPVAAGVQGRANAGKGRTGPTTPKAGASGCTEPLGGRKRGPSAGVSGGPGATGLSGGSVDLGVSTDGEAAGVSELMGIYDWVVSEWGQANVCVLIEDFIPRKPDKSRAFLSPPRLTAQIDYALWLRGAGSWRQSSVDAGVGKNNKSGANDKRLVAWGFYNPRVTEHLGEVIDSEIDPDGMLLYEIRRVTGGKGAGKEHARDADRHAIIWLRRCKSGKKAASLRAECWPGAYRS